MSGFPDLGDWLETRRVLHGYARVLGAVRGTLVPPHPLWWHVSLRVYPGGLTTRRMALPEDPDRGLEVRLDLRRHALELTGVAGGLEEPLVGGDGPRRLAGVLAGRLKELGLGSATAIGSLEDLEDGVYDPAAGERYRAALTGLHSSFTAVRYSLPGERGPVQLWPHHFDLSFEWFGGREIDPGEGDGRRSARSQIGFGFSPGDGSHAAPYLYATPWPFQEEWTGVALPAPARWQTEGWQGGLLPYAALATGGDGLLREFFQAAHRISSPDLA